MAAAIAVVLRADRVLAATVVDLRIAAALVAIAARVANGVEIGLATVAAPI